MKKAGPRQCQNGLLKKFTRREQTGNRLFKNLILNHESFLLSFILKSIKILEYDWHTLYYEFVNNPFDIRPYKWTDHLERRETDP